MTKSMNKIEKLIAKHCPEGVEFKDVGTLIDDKAVTTVNPPKKLTKKHYKPVGTFPIVDQGQNFIVGYTDDNNAVVANGLYVIFGDHTEAIKYVDFAFTQGADGIKVLKTNTGIINTRFFYYVLNNFYEKTGKYTRHFSFLKKTKIPIPPLAIQQEIVKILDTFTTLEAELEAELEARKKQYEYYRDEMLTFGEDVEWKTLGEVCNNVGSGGTPLSTRSDYYGGDIPWLRTQEVRFVNIYDTEVKITEKGLKNSSAKWIPANCVIVAISGATAARSAINKIPLTTNQHCCNLEINPRIANYRYVFHWVSCQYEKLKAFGQGARADLNSGIIKNFPIPIPPLAEQERIVAILDKFDALVNDISVGLPAELNARRKQYEYYRNKLLTFKNSTLREGNHPALTGTPPQEGNEKHPTQEGNETTSSPDGTTPPQEGNEKHPAQEGNEI